MRQQSKENPELKPVHQLMINAGGKDATERQRALAEIAALSYVELDELLDEQTRFHSRISNVLNGMFVLGGIASVPLILWASYTTLKTSSAILNWLIQLLCGAGVVLTYVLLAKRQRRKNMLLYYGLYSCDRLRVLGPMIVNCGKFEGFKLNARHFGNVRDSMQEHQILSRVALLRLLPLVTSDQPVVLTANERYWLEVILKGRDSELVQMSLRALPVLGQYRDIAIVRDLEGGAWSGRQHPEVRAEATRCRVAMEAMHSVQPAGKSLLRPSQIEVDQTTMVRASASTDPSDNGQP